VSISFTRTPLLGVTSVIIPYLGLACFLLMCLKSPGNRRTNVYVSVGKYHHIKELWKGHVNRDLELHLVRDFRCIYYIDISLLFIFVQLIHNYNNM
jgi:hypothetical protein